MQRRTRIVATLGPATDRPGVLETLIANGLNVARINFSHGQPPEHLERIQRFRNIARQHHRNVAVLADLPGPKLRALFQTPLDLATGATLTLARHKGAAADAEVTEFEALTKVAVGHRVLLDDGRLQARVSAVSGAAVTLTIEVGGKLLPNKGINLPDSELDIPAVTQRDRIAIDAALQAGVDWFALSFVRDASAANDLRAILREKNSKTPVLAKIERPEAVTKAAAIIDAFDGIMVARGDLGVEIALEKVPHVQKFLIDAARCAGKPVITATDMLDSMRKNPRPTRAEVSDVANAAYDGTDAVMLSGETAAGDYPVEAFQCMVSILREAEINQDLDCPRPVAVPRGSRDDLITHAVCELAYATGAQAIVVPTVSGRTVRLLARHRPKLAIVAVSSDAAVLRQLAVVWGVEVVQMPAECREGDDLMHESVCAVGSAKIVPAGAHVTVLARHPVLGGQEAPTIRMVRVP